MTIDTNYGAPHIEPTKFEQQEPKFRTLHDRILVKRDDAPEKIGLIYVPSKEPPNRGKVVAIGRDRDVAVGDHVLFIKNAGSELKIEGEKRLIMFEMDIYGVLEGDSLRPISNKVLIKPDPPSEKRGLIILPDPKAERAREQLVSGEIVAMGQGMRTKSGGRWPMADVKVGQRVLYFQNYTPELSIGGVTYVVVVDDQLRAVIEE
jgi:co-chaperonin GroES (HSP10)